MIFIFTAQYYCERQNLLKKYILYIFNRRKVFSNIFSAFKLISTLIYNKKTLTIDFFFLGFIRIIILCEVEIRMIHKDLDNQILINIFTSKFYNVLIL